MFGVGILILSEENIKLSLLATSAAGLLADSLRGRTVFLAAQRRKVLLRGQGRLKIKGSLSLSSFMVVSKRLQSVSNCVGSGWGFEHSTRSLVLSIHNRIS